MNIRHSFCLLAALLTVCAGCNRSASKPGAAPTPLATNTAARVHWLGKNKLGIESGAYYLMRLWELQESRQLQNQTLDKLALAPWTLLHPDSQPSPVIPALARPLLDDVVQQECFFEMRQVTDSSRETVFAIQLNDQRSGIWRTNLVGLLASLTGVETMTLGDEGRSWTVRKPGDPNLVELVRVGDWTVVGAAGDTNRLLAEVVSRIRGNGAPFVPATNNWLDITLDRATLSRLFPATLPMPDEIARVSIALNGDGGNVLTTVEIATTKTESANLPQWAAPSTLIHDSLVGFTAARGFGSRLAQMPWWSRLQLGNPPDQIFCWSPAPSPMELYAAVPMDGVSDRFESIARVLTQRANPSLATNGAGSFVPAGEGSGVGMVWQGLPAVSPFIRPAQDGSMHYLLAGSIAQPQTETGSGMPSELAQELSAHPRLVYYDWEFTGRRIESSLYMGQIVRAALGKPQFPLESVSASWLRAIMPRLAPSTTTGTALQSGGLTFSRKSTAGFTSAELQWLVDWLESPRFPRGLHSTSFVLEPSN